VLGAANIIVVIASHGLDSSLEGLKGLNSQQGVVSEQMLGNLAVASLQVLALIVVSVALSLWALTIWLNRLTVYAHAFFQSEAPRESDFRMAAESVKERAKFLNSVWLFDTIFLIVPVFPLSVLIAFKILTSSEFNFEGNQFLQLPNNLFWLDGVATAAIALLSLLTVACTFSIIAFASVSKKPPFATALAANAELFRQLPTAFLTTTLVLGANVALTAPHLLLFFTSIPAMVKSNMILGILAQIWLAFASPFAWTLSLAPYCQSIKQANTAGGITTLSG
jgi:hypothetical protein